MSVGKYYIWKGKIVEESEVNINIFDRGYNFGDGIYEVSHIYNGKMFTADEHIDRLFSSAKKIEMNLKLSKDEVKKIMESIIAENNVEQGYIYIQVTRGDLDVRKHGFHFYEEQEVVISGFTVENVRPQDKNHLPVNAIITEDKRGTMCDVKSLNLLPNVIAMHQAQKKGARKAILAKSGYITEEKSGNVLIVKDDIIYTHPDGVEILPGITKMVIKRICEAQNLNYLEQKFTCEDLYAADEVMVVDTNSEIVPINEVDGKVIGSGERGYYSKLLQELYEKEVIKECGEL